MKILCYIHSMGLGGAQRVLSVLMNAWVANGKAVTLLTHKGEPSLYPLDNRISEMDLGEIRGGGLTALLKHCRRISRLRRAINVSSPDVVLSFGDTSNVRALLAAKNVPVVISERIDPLSGHRLGFWWQWQRRRVYRRASALVVQHRAQADFFRDLSPRVEVIPNPIALEQFSSHPASERGNVVLAAGRLHNQKGFDVLIRAFARVADQYPDWKLTILGEGKQRASLESLAREKHLADRVLLPGTTRDVSGTLSRCGCFVLASRFEGMPNALLEAMASGCPVVSTKCSPSITALIEDGRNGFLVPVENEEALADGLGRMMGDERSRERLAVAGRESVKALAVENVLPQWEPVLSGAAEG